MVKAKVKTLNKSNFKKNVFDSNKMWIVKFYAPWCSPCKRLEPIWKKASKKVKGKVNFGEVDCTSEIKLAKKYKIRGYPTIKFFYKSKKNTMIYKGNRNIKNIIRYSLKKYINNGKPLKKSSNQIKFV